MYNDGFSEFEIKESSIKVGDDESFEKIGCVGTAEETLNIRFVTKTCEGVEVLKKAYQKGTGKLKLTGHIKWSAYKKMLAIVDAKLKKGVGSWGTRALPNFTYVAKVYDEMGDVKYKAYPNCSIASDFTRKIENGAEEVAELDIELDLSPDADGCCMYECLPADLESSNPEIPQQWMTAFSRTLVEA